MYKGMPIKLIQVSLDKETDNIILTAEDGEKYHIKNSGNLVLKANPNYVDEKGNHLVINCSFDFYKFEMK